MGVTAQLGDTLECIKPKSNAYTKGKKYKVVKDTAGILGLKGDDTLFDPLYALQSSFRKVKVEDK